MFRHARSLTLTAGLLCCATQWAIAQQTASPFEVHWNVGIAGNVPMNVSTLPFRRDVVLFDHDTVGRFLRAGPHMIETWPEGKEAFYAEHFAKMAVDIAASYKIPDPNWSGYAVIDYELWGPYWTLHENTPSTLGPEALDRDFQDDWRDYIRNHRPQLLAGLEPAQQEQVFMDTWLDTTREFFRRTIAEAKRLRPNAKWGFYNLPWGNYHMFVNDHVEPHRSRRADLPRFWGEEMAWLWEECDAFYPSYYTPYVSVASPRTGQRQDSYEQNTRWLNEMTAELLNYANGKPVLPYIWYQYHDGGTSYGGPLVNDFNLRSMVEITGQAGATGVILWGWIPNTQERNRVEPFLRDRLLPTFSNAIADVNALRAPQPDPDNGGGEDPTPTPGDSGGGGDPAPLPNPSPSDGGNNPTPAPSPTPTPTPTPTPPPADPNTVHSVTNGSGSTPPPSNNNSNNNSGGGSPANPQPSPQPNPQPNPQPTTQPDTNSGTTSVGLPSARRTATTTPNNSGIRFAAARSTRVTRSSSNNNSNSSSNTSNPAPSAGSSSSSRSVAAATRSNRTTYTAPTRGSLRDAINRAQSNQR